MQHIWLEPMAAPHRKMSMILKKDQCLNLKDVAKMLGFDPEAPLRLQLANNTVSGIPMAGLKDVKWSVDDLRTLTGRAGCETAPFLLQGLPLDAIKNAEAARAQQAAPTGPLSAPAASQPPPVPAMRDPPPRKSVARKRPAKASAPLRLKDKTGQFVSADPGAATESAAAAQMPGVDPGESPSDERIQQLASVASDQQYGTLQDPAVMGGQAPQPFMPGMHPAGFAGPPMMAFEQPPPMQAPVQTLEQELAGRERNDGLPLSKEESDDEVHPLPDAASGFRKRQKKIDHIPVRSSSIPGMTVGNVRKTLNQIRKAGNAIKSEHLLWNGWPAGRFALAYIKGHHEKRKQGKKSVDVDDEEGEEETGDEAPPLEPEAPPMKDQSRVAIMEP